MIAVCRQQRKPCSRSTLCQGKSIQPGGDNEGTQKYDPMPGFLEKKAFPRKLLPFTYLLYAKKIDKHKTIAGKTSQRIIIQASLKDYSQQPYHTCCAEWTNKKYYPPRQSFEKPEAPDKSSFHIKNLTNSIVSRKRLAKGRPRHILLLLFPNSGRRARAYSGKCRISPPYNRLIA